MFRTSVNLKSHVRKETGQINERTPENKDFLQYISSAYCDCQVIKNLFLKVFN